MPSLDSPKLRKKTNADEQQSSIVSTDTGFSLSAGGASSSSSEKVVMTQQQQLLSSPKLFCIQAGIESVLMLMENAIDNDPSLFNRLITLLETYASQLAPLSLIEPEAAAANPDETGKEALFRSTLSKVGGLLETCLKRSATVADPSLAIRAVLLLLRIYCATGSVTDIFSACSRILALPAISIPYESIHPLLTKLANASSKLYYQIEPTIVKPSEDTASTASGSFYTVNYWDPTLDSTIEIDKSNPRTISHSGSSTQNILARQTFPSYGYPNHPDVACSYFEIEVKKIDPGARVHIGIAERKYSRIKHLGYSMISYGYGSNGRYYSGGSTGKAYGRAWKEGDIIGCKWTPSTKEIAFTHNGSNLHKASGRSASFLKNLCPAVSMEGNAMVVANFGPTFQFKADEKITAYAKALSKHLASGSDGGSKNSSLLKVARSIEKSAIGRQWSALNFLVTPVPKCPKGHTYEARPYNDPPYDGGWHCDNKTCNSDSDGGKYWDRWVCVPCTSDICYKCQPKTWCTADPVDVDNAKMIGSEQLAGALLAVLDHTAGTFLNTMLKPKPQQPLSIDLSKDLFTKLAEFLEQADLTGKDMLAPFLSSTPRQYSLMAVLRLFKSNLFQLILQSHGNLLQVRKLVGMSTDESSVCSRVKKYSTHLWITHSQAVVKRARKTFRGWLLPKQLKSWHSDFPCSMVKRPHVFCLTCLNRSRVVIYLLSVKHFFVSYCQHLTRAMLLNFCSPISLIHW